MKTRFAAALLAVSLLTGCGSTGTGFFGQIASALFSSAALADAVFVGFSAGPPEEVAELDEVKKIVESLGFLPGDAKEELQAVSFPLAVRGEADLREVVCAGKLAAKCRLVPLNVEVRISGRPAPDGKIVPVTISWDRRP